MVFILWHFCDAIRCIMFLHMNYVSIVNLIFLIISGLTTLYLFHFIFFAIVSLIHKKRFPQSEEKCRYGVLISAKDEENVIPRLISSIRSTSYPQDKLDIFIIAHNCKDKTAEVASSLGANVIVCNRPEERTLGLAYRYAFNIINIKEYDGFVILNADNVVSKDYFDKLNDAFVYNGKNQVVTSFRHSLNISDGTLPAIYGYYFAAACSLSYVGREDFGVACRVTGCGFVVPSSYLENGWNYTSITEDIEFSADKVLEGKIIHYCDDAVFYDEQPRDFVTMWYQRLRWAKGQNMTSKKYFGKFFKALFKKETKNRFSIFIAMTFNSFIPLMFLFTFLLQLILLFFSPLFGISFQETFLYWDYSKNWFENLFLSLNVGALFTLSRSVINVIVYSYIVAIGTLIASRGKFKGQAKWPMISGFIMFPFFLLLQAPLDITVLFMKEVKWRKIPHGMNKK